MAEADEQSIWNQGLWGTKKSRVPRIQGYSSVLQLATNRDLFLLADPSHYFLLR